MVAWVNRNKRLIQIAVGILGTLMLVATLSRAYVGGVLSFGGRGGEAAMKGASKPAEIGIFVLVALFALRMAFRIPWVRERGRALLRLLQVVHVPLGLVVLAAAAVHGLLYLIYNFKNDLHTWTGIVGLALMVPVAGFGLFVIKRPARKGVHLTLGLLTFAVVCVHIFGTGGEEHHDRPRFDRRGQTGSVLPPGDTGR